MSQVSPTLARIQAEHPYPWTRRTESYTANLESAITDLDRQLAERDERIASMLQKQNEADAIYDRTRDERDTLRNQLDEARDLFQRQAAETDKANALIDELRHERNVRQKINADLEAENPRLREQLAEADGALLKAIHRPYAWCADDEAIHDAALARQEQRRKERE